METNLQQKNRIITTLDDITKNNNSVVKVKNKNYKNYSPPQLCNCVIGWVLQKKRQVCLNTVKIRLYQGQLCLNT